MKHALISISLVALAACSGGEGDDRDGSAAAMDGGTITLPDGRVVPIPPRDSGGGGVDSGGTGYDGSLVPTGEHCDGPCACSDGADNDDDGEIDANDPECTGPTDDDEATFGTGIPGDNRDGAFQDCFFDGDSGHGNDGCQYRTCCLYGTCGPSEDCSVSAACLERCRPAVPNGCDCFGCCTIHLDDGTTRNVLSSSACSVEVIDDPELCMTCTLHEECVNECGDCELCPGRTPEDLPEECFETPDGGVPIPMCEGGTPCTVPEDCDLETQYCSLGCCLSILI